MASDQSDIVKVDPEELYEPSAAVQVDDVEEVAPKDVKKDDSKEENKVEDASAAKDQKSPTTHETPFVKTTTDKEGEKLSMKDKIKGKIEKLGDKLRPQEAVDAKNSDPHPNMV